MASITCGNCGSIHSSVAAVRQCHTLTPRSREEQQAAVERHAPTRQAFHEYTSRPQPRREPAPEGFYFYQGNFYKVQTSHYGSGRRYAKLAIPPDEDGGRVIWEYAKGVVMDLRPEHRVTKEQAAEFGALYGRCIRCGRILTREESIEQSMGPVCSGKMGW